MTTEEFLQLKKKLDDCKAKLAALQAQYNAILEQLARDYGIDSRESLETQVAKTKRELESLGAQVKQAINDLKAKYPQLFEGEKLDGYAIS